VKLNFLNIIREDASNKRLKDAIFKYLNKRKEQVVDHPDEFIDEIEELFDLNQSDVIEIVFDWLVNIAKEDPISFHDLNYDNVEYTYKGDFVEMLERIGWFDKFFNNWNTSLKDIEVVGEGGLSGKDSKIFLEVLNWYEFAGLFSDVEVAERVLSEDWSDLYGWFDVQLTEFWDDINDESINHIINHMVERYGDEPFDNWVEELQQFEDEDGVVYLNDEVISFIRNHDTKDILKQLIGEHYDFEELRDELKTMYRWAYEGAAEDELFSNMKEEVVSLFGSEPKWVKGEGDKQNLMVDVTKMYYPVLKKYMKRLGELPSSHSDWWLEVLIKVLDEEDEKLSSADMTYFHPDNRKVAEHLNYNIQGNI
jgi:hypothetical protein